MEKFVATSSQLLPKAVRTYFSSSDRISNVSSRTSQKSDSSGLTHSNDSPKTPVSFRSGRKVSIQIDPEHETTSASQKGRMKPRFVKQSSFEKREKHFDRKLRRSDSHGSTGSNKFEPHRLSFALSEASSGNNSAEKSNSEVEDQSPRSARVAATKHRNRSVVENEVLSPTSRLKRKVMAEMVRSQTRRTSVDRVDTKESVQSFQSFISRKSFSWGQQSFTRFQTSEKTIPSVFMSCFIFLEMVLEFLTACSKQIASAFFFNAVLVLVLLSSLFIDDLRVLDKADTDDTYGVAITMFLLVVLFDIAVSFMSNPRFLWSANFFWDVLIVATFVFELPWVIESGFEKYELQNGLVLKDSVRNHTKSQQNHLLFVKVARILRLVRLVKIWRSSCLVVNSFLAQTSSLNLFNPSQKLEKEFAEKALQRQSSRDSRQRPGSTISDYSEVQSEFTTASQDANHHHPTVNMSAKREASRHGNLGRALVDITVRRVICVIVIMMYVHSWFSVSDQAIIDVPIANSRLYSSELVATSWGNFRASYEMDREAHFEVLDISRDVGRFVSGFDFMSEKTKEFRKVYEQNLMLAIYIHNWHAVQETSDHECRGSFSECAAAGFSGLAFIEWDSGAGYDARDSWTQPHVQMPPFVNLNGEINSNFDAVMNDENFDYDSGSLPITIQNKLAQPWEPVCTNENNRFLSVSIADFECPIDSNVFRFDDFSVFGRSKPGFYMDSNNRQNNASSYGSSLRFLYDDRSGKQEQARTSMKRTIFLLGCLVFMGLLVVQDQRIAVVKPIEQIAATLNKISKDPMEAIKLAEKSGTVSLIEDESRMSDILDSADSATFCSKMKEIGKVLIGNTSNASDTTPLETVVLEKTLIRLGELLVLGFGEAGVRIIGENMRASNSSSINALVPGKVVQAIIGYVSINEFSMAAEVLRGNVMVFVNQVSEIVHGMVNECYGAPAENLGSTFLVVWHYNDFFNDYEKERLSDLALFSFTKIAIAVNTCDRLRVYREHPAFLQRKRNYSVRLSFGLHCGWAIEGAVGSEFKVNPAYLSPNVNTAKQLCQAAQHYRICICLSEEIVENLSDEMSDECRIIDRVTLPGSTLPTRLFAFDFDQDMLRSTVTILKTHRRSPAEEQARKFVENMFHAALRIAGKSGLEKAENFIKHPANQANLVRKCKLLRDQHREGLWLSYTDIHELLLEDRSWKIMRDTFNDRFFQSFDSAFRNYESGEWECARTFFEQAEMDLNGVTSDGVCFRLLEFMRERDYQPPADWKGYRSLAF